MNTIEINSIITSIEQWRALSPDMRVKVRQDHFRSTIARNPMTLADPRRLERAYPDSDKPYRIVEGGIAIIDISGPLVNYESWWYSSYPVIRRMIGDAAVDAAVKGILLHVNSPGGEVEGSFVTADDIEAAAALKPVWAVADSDAFSAGYLLASAAGRIYVQPETGGVGSIGVICQHVEYAEYLKHEGVKVTAIYEGERKNDFTPYEPLTKDAKAVLAAEVARLYGLFVDAVARRRKMSTDAVRATEAGLYFGTSGIGAGLADRPGDMMVAIEDMRAELAKSTLSGFSAAATAPAVATSTKEVAPMADTNNPAAVAAVDQERIRSEATAAGFAAATDQARQIVAMCGIAGRPQLATGFLAEGKTVAQVITALAEAKASGQETTEINSQVPAGGKDGGYSLAAAMKAKFASAGKGAN